MSRTEAGPPPSEQSEQGPLKRFYRVPGHEDTVLQELIPHLAMAVPVEQVTDEQHGEGVALQLGTKEQGQTGQIRIFPEKRLALLTSQSYGLAVQGLEWVEPAQLGIRLSGRSGNQVITVTAGVSGQLYVRASMVRPVEAEA